MKIYLIHIICVLLHITFGQCFVYWQNFPSGGKVVYQGKLFLREKQIDITPKIQAISSEGSTICGFTLYADLTSVGNDSSKVETQPLPVYISIQDPSGLADVLIKPNSIITESEYRFQMQAVDCNENSQQSDKADVIIKVYPSRDLVKQAEEQKHQQEKQETKLQENGNNINNNEAGGAILEWSQPVYNARISDTLDAGQTVVQVNAYRKSGNKNEPLNVDHSAVCDYMIVAPRDAPFDVDGNGVVRVMSNLNAAKHRNYVLRVLAKECKLDNPLTSTVSVNIDVYSLCATGWTGVAEQLNYSPGAGVQRFATEAELRICHGRSTCLPRSVTTTINLSPKANPQESGKWLDRGCDHDVYSLKTMRELCGANDEAAELLPSMETFAQQSSDHSSLGTAEAYQFDGKQTHWEVPTSVIPADHNLGMEFTFSFWMKHSPPTDPNAKEQIMCNADGHSKNRHHYAVFIHHCKLVVLLRQEASSSSSNSNVKSDGEMFPSEWRFQLNNGEICDNRWHHYSLSRIQTSRTNDNFGGPPAAVGSSSSSSSSKSFTMRLLLDGRAFVTTDANNPQIVDDWLMHPLPGQDLSTAPFTKLTIGACWHAAEKRFTQFFAGELAGVMLLRDRTESDAVVHCVNQCQEKLDFHAMNEMSAGMSVSLNSELSMLIVNGHNVSEVAKLIQAVGYVNSRARPTPGKRIIKLNTEIKCTDSMTGEQKVLNIPDHDVTILVLPAPPHQPAAPLKPSSSSSSAATEISPSQPVKVNEMENKKEPAQPTDSTVHIARVQLDTELPIIRMSDDDDGDDNDDDNDNSDNADNDEPLDVHILATISVASVSMNMAIDSNVLLMRGSPSQPSNVRADVNVALDSCLIRAQPTLQSPWEYVHIPKSSLDTNLPSPYSVNSSHGLVMEGDFAASVYERMLRKVRYVRHHSKLSIEKHQQSFFITCSQQNAEEISNELEIVVELPEINMVANSHDLVDPPQPALSAHNSINHNNKVAIIKDKNSLDSSAKLETSTGGFLLISTLVGCFVFLVVAFFLVRQKYNRSGGGNSCLFGRSRRLHPGVEVVPLPLSPCQEGLQWDDVDGGNAAIGGVGLNNHHMRLTLNPMNVLWQQQQQQQQQQHQCMTRANGRRAAGGSGSGIHEDTESLLDGIPPQAMDTLDNYDENSSGMEDDDEDLENNSKYLPQRMTRSAPDRVFVSTAALEWDNYPTV